MGAPDAATQKALDHCTSRLNHSLEELKKLVRIPGVSFDGFDPSQVRDSASAAAEHIHSSGMKNVEVIQFGDVHPYVFAEWMEHPDLPTVLLYAHHDVQPPGDEKGWNSKPFDPVERGGRLFGRGTADDKVGILAHTAAISAYLNTAGRLPVNVKLLIEGEEEIGSSHLAEFVRRHREKLRADCMILTDCSNIDTGIPSITTSLRGLVSVDVELRGLPQPVHSGFWGGVVPDPAIALAQLLGKLTDEEGNILIPGILDDVRPLSVAEIKEFSTLDLEKIVRAGTQLPDHLPLRGTSEELAKRMWREPSLSVLAFESGSRKMVANIIQDGAWARVSMRIVPDMKPQKTQDILSDFLRSHCPRGFEITITPEAAADWWTVQDLNDPIFDIAARSLEKGYGQKTRFVGCGASIPFVQPLSQELGGIPAVLLGVEDPYSNPHSDNESLHLDDFRKILISQVHMLGELARYRRG
ncbi:MAG TPA: M20/M25/M40 family metallo-hydrolase [Leptospiraceae bacterium]|nr:M20/M25/M40 family metallo-hydrolase [Leptospirales bacterium]HMU82789.1 M20/M25/M40 family metallo-hydrolase [Leptospiraceae bacterium]HMX57398.1 M20/M25/M40 family metallo-hydrolase [Leptospiraceae bacterium]HMY44473.1 M20/M25/M40 family metallo-hydrolase [Leptospiraceae bacterium]HMZ35096.1 M20/M25/M40 family metallo-hydrolase [Leptospiraceae bacterium]